MLPELSLKDSEIRYRRLFESAQDGILILDANTGMIEDVNPYLINMLGYSREEFIKKKLWEVGAFRDIEANKEAFETLQDNEYIRYENLPLKTKAGQLIEVEFVSNVYLAGGEKVIQCNIRDNTEHKRLIRALQENEQKYFNLLNQSSDGIFIIDLAGNILTVNNAMCRELGYSEEEFLSMNIWDIIPPHYMDQYRQRLTKILAGESFEEAGEYEVRGKNGENHYVEVLSTPHYNGKNIIGFQGIARDVTRRKQAEQALRESEAQNRTLLEHLPTVVYMNALDDTTTTLYVSPQIQTLLGYTPQEWLADPKLWLKTLHPEDRALVLKQAFYTNQSKEPFEMDYRMIAQDGHLVWVHDQIVLVHDVEGKPKFWQGIMLDITARKQAEEQTRFQAALLNTVGQAVIATDDIGTVTYLNQAAENLYGWRAEEALGHNILDVTVPQVSQTQGQEIMASLSRGKSWSGEFLVQHRDGRVFPAEVYDSPIFNSKNVLIGVIGVSSDITDRKQAEEALARSEKDFRNLAENALVGIFRTTTQGEVKFVNESLARIFGFNAPQEMMGEDVLLHYKNPSDRDIVLKILKKESRINNYEIDILTRAGETRNILLSATIENELLSGMIIDITERTEAEQRIRRQVDYLTALQDIDRAIASSLGMRQNLNILISTALSLLGVDAAAILLINITGDTLEYLAGDGFRTESFNTEAVQLDESYAGRAVLERRIVKIPDLSSERHNVFLTSSFKMEDFIGYYAAPLILKDKVIGVFELFQRSHVKHDQEWLDFFNALTGQAAIAVSNGQLFENLQNSNNELTKAYNATIEGWSHALDLRDKETEGHSQRVTQITVKLASTFAFTDAELKQIRWGALLHDIGKMGVPDGILLKPDPLTDQEWVTMKKHPTFAYEMLSPIRYLQLALDIPYCHHEKWDGTGYPRGLKGIEIPLCARIFAVVDVWDALSSDRPYRPRWRNEKVREHIQALSGTHFDPEVVNCFFKMMERPEYVS